MYELGRAGFGSWTIAFEFKYHVIGARQMYISGFALAYRTTSPDVRHSSGKDSLVGSIVRRPAFPYFLAKYMLNTELALMAGMQKQDLCPD